MRHSMCVEVVYVLAVSGCGVSGRLATRWQGGAACPVVWRRAGKGVRCVRSSGDALTSGCGVSGRRECYGCQDGGPAGRKAGDGTSTGAVCSVMSPASACHTTREVDTVESRLCCPQISDDQP